MKNKEQIQHYLKELQGLKMKDVPINDVLPRIGTLIWILED
jgi:hypothetical protein